MPELTPGGIEPLDHRASEPLSSFATLNIIADLLRVAAGIPEGPFHRSIGHARITDMGNERFAFDMLNAGVHAEEEVLHAQEQP